MIDLYPIAGPLLRRLDPETAHGVTIAALKSGLAPRSRMQDDPILRSSALGAGLRQSGRACRRLRQERGSGRRHAGPGLRLRRDRQRDAASAAGQSAPAPVPAAGSRAMINRYGFNNDGLDAVAGRLAARRGAAGAGRRQCRQEQGNRRCRRRLRDRHPPAGSPGVLSGDQRLLAQHAGLARTSGPRAAGRAARPVAGRAGGRRCRRAARRRRCCSRSRPT